MTAQISDILIYKNEELCIASEPLSDYLAKVKLPHKLVAPNTACWRGYYAKWAIDNKKLFLIKWQGYILDYQKVDIQYIFPGEEVVFAKWYTGEIRIGMGDLVSYVHGGYASVYEGDMFLIFENGELVNEYTKWLTKEEIEIITKEKDDPIW
jgi:hypothetical protein